METKRLSAKIPVDLHDKITAEKEKSEITLSEYVTNIITKYYELIEIGDQTMSQEMRTLAVQVSQDLMERVKTHLKRTGISQKTFIINIIEKALKEAEYVITAETTDEETLATELESNENDKQEIAEPTEGEINTEIADEINAEANDELNSINTEENTTENENVQG